MVGRNNTNFFLETQGFLSKIPKDERDVLRYHQRILIEYYKKYVAALSDGMKGTLAYWDPGAGKTLGAVSIAEMLLLDNFVSEVVLIASKSLHTNFIKNIKSYLQRQDSIKWTNEKTDEHIKKHYKFISSNASNMFEKVTWLTMQTEQIIKTREGKKQALDDMGLGIETLNGKFVIVDEAQDLFNSIVNGSKNATQFYKLVMRSHKVRLLFLSGTPIVNDPFEQVPCFNMLTGQEILGSDYKSFSHYFVDREHNSIKNEIKFQNRLAGLVSYYSIKSDPKIREKFPKQEKTIIQNVHMSETQFSSYILARTKEREATAETALRGFRPRTPSMQKPSSLSSSYRVNSRQASNYAIPDYAIEDFIDEEGHKRQIKHIDQIKEADLLNLKVRSPKFLRIIENAEKHIKLGQIGLVYSQFVQMGIGLFGKCLTARGWKECRGRHDENGPKPLKKGEMSFAIIAGDVPIEVRDEIVRLYNSPENKYGDYISLLLVSSTGAQGLDLKNVRHIHVMEPYWNYSRIKQVFGRGNRFESHIDLPPKDRTMQPYIYMSDYPTGSMMDEIIKEKSKSTKSKTKKEQQQRQQKKGKGEEGEKGEEEIVQDIIDNAILDYKEYNGGDEKESMNNKEAINEKEDLTGGEMTTDVELYIKAVRNQMKIDTFLDSLQRISFDCFMNYRTVEKCRVCVNTDEELFYPNLDKDMNLPSPCKKLEKEKVKAKEIILSLGDHDDKESFFYTVEDGDIYIFKKNPNLDIYDEIDPSYPYYDDIYSAIKKKIKK